MKYTEESPCDECLITTVCFRMCDKAKPYFERLVVVDKHFSETAYEERRERIYDELINDAQDEEAFSEARKLLGIDEQDNNEYFFGGQPLQKKKGDEHAEDRKQPGTGTKILRKIKHFCVNHFKNKGVD